MNLKAIPLVFRIHAVALVLTLLLVGATAKYGIGSGLRHMRFLKLQETHYSDQLGTQTDLRNTVGEGQAKLQQVRQQTAVLEKLLPSEMNFQEFFGQLNTCAQATHCELSGMQPGQPEPGDGYQVMQVPFKVYGNFAGLYAFLDRVLNAPRICKLERLDVHGGQSGQGGSGFQADVVLNIYCAAAREASHAG